MPQVSPRHVTGPPSAVNGRLDSWKEIARFLKRGARTVQRWEREEGLPVHRLRHDKLGSVYAYPSELDAWWAARGAELRDDSPAAPRAASSVAVLPFADLSEANDQNYFCDGIAEEIIDSLSRAPGLRVASRTSSFRFRSPANGTREIGRLLRVGTILEGSVRKSGDRLRITVQLTNAGDGFQLWTARYDREMKDIFAIQDEIARHAVRALQSALSETAAGHDAPSACLSAHDCYLRGREFYNQFSLRAVEFALQMFLRAMELDPDYAAAYAGLADCWSYMYLYSDRSEAVRDQADWASARAVEMDHASAQAQASRGMSLSLQHRDEEAEQAFETAIQLDPGLFEAHYFYARHSFARGRFAKAAARYEAAIEARPDDYQSPLLVAQIYDGLGRHADASAARKRGIRIAGHHLKLNPDDARALYLAANAWVALGEHNRGRRDAERARAILPDDPVLLYNVGCIFSMLGLQEPALDCLEKAAAGVTHKGWYEHDSNLDALRAHPRFLQLLDRLR